MTRQAKIQSAFLTPIGRSRWTRRFAFGAASLFLVPDALATPEKTPPAAAQDDWNFEEFTQENFAVTLETPRSVRVGERAIGRVSIMPLAPFHMNMDYPTALHVQADEAVTLSRSHYRSKDAIVHSENATGFEFEFTARKSGTPEIRTHLKFAVCAQDSCQPHSFPASFRVTATVPKRPRAKK